MPDPNPAASILCEPAQSKRTWTFEKSHFVKNYRKNVGRVWEHSIKHRAFINCDRKNQGQCQGQKKDDDDKNDDDDDDDDDDEDDDGIPLCIPTLTWVSQFYSK